MHHPSNEAIRFLFSEFQLSLNGSECLCEKSISLLSLLQLLLILKQIDLSIQALAKLPSLNCMFQTDLSPSDNSSHCNHRAFLFFSLIADFSSNRLKL